MPDYDLSTLTEIGDGLPLQIIASDDLELEVVSEGTSIFLEGGGGTELLVAGDGISIYIVPGGEGPPGTTGPPGSPGLVWRGTYNSGTTYAAYDVVAYNSGSGIGSYISLVNSNHGNSPFNGSSYWAYLAQEGQRGANGANGSPGRSFAFYPGGWNVFGNYSIDDAILYNGSGYVSLYNSNIGHQPDITPYWAMFASKGDVGPPGDPASDGRYTHTQNTTSTLWTIDHNLGKYPSIQSFDSANTQIMGELVHVSINQATISFNTAISGYAYCN